MKKQGNKAPQTNQDVTTIKFIDDTVEEMSEKEFRKYIVGAGDLAQLVACLPRKHKALGSIPSTTKQTNKQTNKQKQKQKNKGTKYLKQTKMFQQ